MNEPKRLFESGSSLERSVLGFGRDEAPSNELARKTLAAMAAVPTASAAAPAPSRLVRPRWLLAGACALGLAVVGVGVVRRDGATSLPDGASAATCVEALPSAERAPSPPSEVDEGPVVAERAPTPEDDVVVTPDSLPSAPTPAATTSAGPRVAVRAPAATTAAPASSASIAREVELLDRVKAELGAGDAAAAGRALDAYDSEFSQGTLRPEATVLRVRTLLAQDDRQRAERVGAEFLASHPGGVHAKRVRSLLAQPSAAPPGRAE